MRIYTIALMTCLYLSACAQPSSLLISKYRKEYKTTQKKVTDYEIEIAHYVSKQIPPISQKQYTNWISVFKSESIKGFFEKHKIAERDIKWYLAGYNDLVERLAAWKGFELSDYDLKIYASAQTSIVQSKQRVDIIIQKMLDRTALEKYCIGIYLKNTKHLSAAEFIAQTVITPKEFQTFFGQLDHDFEAMMGRFERMR